MSMVLTFTNGDTGAITQTITFDRTLAAAQGFTRRDGAGVVLEQRALTADESMKVLEHDQLMNRQAMRTTVIGNIPTLVANTGLAAPVVGTILAALDINNALTSLTNRIKILERTVVALARLETDVDDSTSGT